MAVLFVFSVLTAIASVYSMECTTGIPPQYCQDTHTITVQSDCNNETSFCSLTSAIKHIISGEQWIIQVNYSHSMSATTQCSRIPVRCLIICGIGQQVHVSVNDNLCIKNVNKFGGFLKFTNIHFDFVPISSFPYSQMNSLSSFDYIQFSNVIVSNGFDWQLSAENITISDSLFNANSYSNAVLQLNASNNCIMSNVTIKNSTLFQKKGKISAPISISPNGGALQLVQIIDCHIIETTGNHLSYSASAGICVSNVHELTIAFSEFIGKIGSSFSYILYIESSSNMYKANISNVIIQEHTATISVIYYKSHYDIQVANIENSLFSWNSGTVITYTQCSSNCSLVLTNNTFTQSQGMILEAESVPLHLLLSNNTVSSITNQIFTDIAIFDMRQCLVTFSAHNVFTNNIGTVLKLTNPQKIFFDENSSLEFYNNTGRNGGGMGIICNGFCLCPQNDMLSSKVNFTNNLAIFGGAVYINTDNVDLICNLSQIFIGVTFIDNQAITEGNDILAKYNGNYNNRCGLSDYIVVIHYSEMNLTSIDNESSILLTLFPGEYIRFKASSSATCESILYLTCNGSVRNCQINNIRLHGSETIVIHHGDLPIYTNLQLRAPNESFTNISLSVSCLDYTSTIPINIRPCPLSYTYNMTCIPCSDCNSELYVFSVTPYQSSVVCLKHGYWYGEGNLIHLCDYPYCRHINDRKECPIAGNKNYFKLPDAVDEQCNGDRSGTLCRGCKNGYTFTYLAVQCVEDKGTQCVGWLIGLVLVSIVINIAVGIFWIVILKWKEGVALGLTLGPVFFLSNVRVLSFGVQPIDIIVSIFSLLILDNSILGYIPVCTPIQSALVYQYFNYIGPLILAVMVGMIYLMANCYSKYNVRLVSPIHAICLLVFVTFWSLASSSIDIVSPVILNNARFSIEPDIPYLHSSVPWYAIILWIIAVIILVAMVALIMLIFITPLLSKWFNMNRIKTFLDFYQSCYKDKLRWYCSVYLIVSMIISITKLLDNKVSIFIAMIVILLLLLFHIVSHPYKNKWFNIADTYLLNDQLLLIIFIFQIHDSSMQIVVSVLVVLPLVYITGIIIALVCRCIPKTWKKYVINLLKRKRYSRRLFSSASRASDELPVMTNDEPAPVFNTQCGYRQGLSLCIDNNNEYGSF